MAKITEKKYSYEYAPKTSLLSRPTDYQKGIIQDAEDGALAKFYNYDEGGNYFEFNDVEFRDHKKDIVDWLNKHPEFEIIKGTFEAIYGAKDNYDADYIKHPNDKYIYLMTSMTDGLDDLQTKSYTYEPKENEIIVVNKKLDESLIDKTTPEYVEDDLNREGIPFKTGLHGNEFYFKTWDDYRKGEEIICQIVGENYTRNDDALCVVIYDEELEEELNKNCSFKGLTKKVVEAKETCSRDYLIYKKQLQRARSIDELRKVWQLYRKDYDADMSFEEDKKLSDLFLERKKELNENLKESWIQFTFEDGSNPYVAKTKEEQDRMFKKYKDRVKQVSDITYLVKSDKKKTNESFDEDKQVTYVWKKDGDDHILTKKGNNKALITLSRMNSGFPWTIYKGNKEITLDNDSDKLSDIKAYILKNVDKILGNKLKEDKSVEDWLKPMFLCDTLEQQDFISFAYTDQDDSVVATTSWETTPRKAHSDYIKTREFLGDRYNINVLRQENRDGNKEFAYVMRITPKGEKVNEADDKYFSSKPNNDIKIKKFVKEYEDEIKKDIDNETYDDYGMWSHYLDMFTIDFPKNKLTTSEFAIKFFNEINKRFGSNFHYGYIKDDLQEAKGKLDDALPELEKYVNEYKDKLVEYGQALAKGEVARPDYKDFTTRFIFDIYYLFKRRGLNLGKYIDENELQDKYIGTLMKKALTNCGVKITKDEYLNESLDTFDDKMDFLAKDEDEAIDGYKKVIKTVDNKNVKAQLKKIETEEKAHKDYLERVKKNKNIKYTEPLDEE